jgi:hypothetical protein
MDIAIRHANLVVAFLSLPPEVEVISSVKKYNVRISDMN